jgi:hypothetical protein
VRLAAPSVYSPAMQPGQQVDLIREAAVLLAKRGFPEIDLVLEQFGRPTAGHAYFADDAYCIEMIKDAPDEELRTLHQYLVGETHAAEPQQWKAGHLRLFMSHLAVHQQAVGLIGEFLGSVGIDAFVAHTSIEPSAEWQNVIESSLRTCDAMAVFLHPGFQESNWCDQEVGFALARRVPVLPLNFGINPYGFMGKFQADKCEGRRPSEIGQRIIDWLVKSPAAQTALAEAAVGALEQSGSFDQTRRIMPVLVALPSFTPDQLVRLDRAAQSNVDVREAYVDSGNAPDRLRRLIAQRGGLPQDAEADDPWSVEPPS